MLVYFRTLFVNEAPLRYGVGRFRLTLSLEIMSVSRPPFQGDSLSVRLPSAEALGYSLLALRAIQNVRTPKGVASNAHPEDPFLATSNLYARQPRRLNQLQVYPFQEL
jgi:hypothetical protein